MAELTFIRPEGNRSHIEILVDEDHTFTVDAYEDDLPCALDASACQVRVQKPGGADLVAKTDPTSVTEGDDGSTKNRLTYALTDTDEKFEDYILTWYAVRNGETEEHEHRVLFDICATKLSNVVREEDLFIKAPGLERNRVTLINGKADSGTTTTLVDAQLKQQPDDWWTGGTIAIVSGTNEGGRRDVSDFAMATGTVTVGTAFPAAIDNTDYYRLRRSWRPVIEAAFEDVKQRVRNEGNRAALIIDSGELYLPVLYHAIQLAYEALSSFHGELVDEGNDWQRAQEYEAKYDAAFKSIPFHYDVTEDGVPDTTLEFSTVRARRR